MTTDNKTKDTILTEKQRKYLHCFQVKLINMNILQVKKFYHLIKVEQQNKLGLYIFHSVKHLIKAIEEQGK